MTSNNTIFKTVVLEIRPRLQSVNVLISLNRVFEGVKIVLNTDSFDIVADITNTICCKNLNIVKDSLSSLNVTKTYISFRFRTVSNLDDWGSFKIELLQISESVFLEKPSKKIFLDEVKLYKIKCQNCSQDLSDEIQFNRILPLPSDNAEPSDWFCHANINYDLNPKENDFFYANCYCHISNKLKNILSSDKILVCRRCLAWLGLLKNQNTCKIWFHTVKFTSEADFYKTCPLQDAFLTLREVLNTILYNTAKIMLCCQSSKSQVDYILLWILEKRLTVKICDSDVRDCTVAKVLFKYESVQSECVKLWSNDANVVSVDVSKPMVLEVLKHLYKFNKIFPKEFSESNGFYISYLMLYGTE